LDGSSGVDSLSNRHPRSCPFGPTRDAKIEYKLSGGRVSGQQALGVSAEKGRMTRDVFVTGGTGYIGQQLTPVLLARGHRVRVLSRATSQGRVPPGAMAVVGDALDSTSIASALTPTDTLVQLVGTPHPNPSKADQFTRVDLAAIGASVDATRRVPVQHFVYVSVAQPAPVMKAFIDVRARGEGLIREAGLTATILRPWYVLGPGHWWPIALAPVYAIAGLIPSMRAGASRLGLVTLRQMVNALTAAIESPPDAGQIRIVEVPAIRTARLG
jgi:uncharacterized protein YbjT (DUF2867 family)